MPNSKEVPLHIVKTKKKIAIIGGNDSWKKAPFDDNDWEIWVIGNQVQQFDHKRVDIIFEIHNDFSNRQEGYTKYLTGLEFPMVVGKDFPDKTPSTEVFDLAKAKEMMGGNYLTSTPAYMMAYALYSRPDLEEIGLWGIDMAVDSKEYFYEQAIAQLWIGFSRGKGVKVTFPEGCPLGEPDYMEGVTGNRPEPMRPYSEADFLEIAKDHQEKIDEITEEMERLNLIKATHDGARQVYKRLSSVGRATDAGQKFETLKQTLRII